MADLGKKTKELTADMKLNDAEMKRDGATTENLRTKETLLRKQIEEQKKTIAKVTEEYEKAVKIKGEDSKEAQYLKSKLTALKTTLATQETQLKKTTEESDNLGDSMDDAKTSADNLKKSGASLGAVLKSGLEAAKNVAAELAESVKALCETTWKIAIEAATSYDDAATAAMMNGVSYEEYMKTMYAAQTSDIDPAAYYNAFTKFKTQFATGNKEDLGKLAEILGLTPEAFSKTFGNAVEGGDWLSIYESILANGGNLSNAQLQKLFGEESVKKLQTVIGDNWKAFSDQRENALEVGFVMTVDEGASLIALSDAYANLQNNWTAMKDNLGAMFAVEVTPLVNDVSSMVGAVSKAIQDSFSAGELDVDAIQKSVAEWLPDILTDGAAVLRVAKIWVDLLNGVFNGGIDGLFDMDTEEGQAAAEEWKSALADLWGDGENGLTGLWNNLKTNVLIPLWNWITQKMEEFGAMLWNAVVNAIPESVRGHLGIQTTEEQAITEKYNEEAAVVIPQVIEELIQPDKVELTPIQRAEMDSEQTWKNGTTNNIKGINITINADVADGTDLADKLLIQIKKGLAELDTKGGSRIVGGGGGRVRMSD